MLSRFFTCISFVSSFLMCMWPTPGVAELSIKFFTIYSMCSRSILSWQTVSSQSWKHGLQWTHVGKMPTKPRAHSSQCFPAIPSLHSHFPVALSHWAISDPSGLQLHSKCMKREKWRYGFRRCEKIQTYHFAFFVAFLNPVLYFHKSFILNLCCRS